MTQNRPGSQAQQKPNAPGKTAAHGSGTQDSAADFDNTSAVNSLLETASAWRDSVNRWGALLASELRLARASIPLLLAGFLLLFLLGFAAWILLVVLVGWGLLQLKISVGIVLGFLLAIHFLLLLAVWFGLRYVLRQAMLPNSRAELRAIFSLKRRRRKAGKKSSSLSPQQDPP